MYSSHDAGNRTKHGVALGSMHDAVDGSVTSRATTKRILIWGLNSDPGHISMTLNAIAAINQCFPGARVDFQDQVKPTSDSYAIIIQNGGNSTMGSLPWASDLISGTWNGYFVNAEGTLTESIFGYARAGRVSVSGINPPPPPPGAQDPQGYLRVVEFAKSGCSPITYGFPPKLRLEFRMPTRPNTFPIPPFPINDRYTIIPGGEAIPLWSIVSGSIDRLDDTPLPLIVEVLGRKGKTRVYSAATGVGSGLDTTAIPFIWTKDIFLREDGGVIDPGSHGWIVGNGNWNTTPTEKSTEQMWRSMYAEICAEVT